MPEETGQILYDGYSEYVRNILGYTSVVTLAEFRLVCEFLHKVFEKLESRFCLLVVEIKYGGGEWVT